MGPLFEVRLALRTLRRAPGSAIVAVLALGLGIGLSTLVFSIIQGAMLRGLPFERPHEIVSLYRQDPGSRFVRMPTIHDYAAWAGAERTVGAIGAYNTATFIFGRGEGEARPERLRGAAVTPSVFGLLGVQPLLGRSFDETDDVPGAAPVLMLNEELWRRRFDGDPSVIGRTLRVDGQETVVIGVLPGTFAFPESQEVWKPLRMDAARTPWGEGNVQVVARLREGVTPERAKLDLDLIAARIADEHPETHAGLGVSVEPYGSFGGNDRAMLFVMLAAVAAVLVIACVNVANLLIGRAIMRTKEVGIRTALGASRWRVALPFLAESAVLAAAGALVGLAVAYIGIGLFVRSVEIHNPPFWIRFSIDGGVLAFVAGAAVVAALLAGSVPALQAARLSLHDTLKDESRGASSFRLGRASRGLVVAEIALSVALLVGAGLLVRSVLGLTALDMGVSTDDVFTARVALPSAAYPDGDAQRRFARDLETRLAGLPGVRTVALAASVPGRFGSNTWVDIEGVTGTDAQDRAYANVPVVSNGYFGVFDAAPIRGRAFNESDGAGAPAVAVVSEAFERRWLDGASALGRRVRIGDESAPWLEVVGVVPDLLESNIQSERYENVYRPLAQVPLRFINLAVRTAGAPLEFVVPLREQVQAIDPDLPVYDVATLGTAIRNDNFRYGIFGSLFASFGAAALVMAAVGLYGVMSFSVGQRRREVGVRMAVGAGAADVLRLILGHGMRQVALGLAIGTPLAFGLSRLIASALYRVSPTDPATFGIIVVLMIGVALLACIVPALRATRVDPLEALRSE